MRALAVLVAGLVSACGPAPSGGELPEGPGPTAAASPAQTGTSRSAPISLAGEWRVAGIDNVDLNEPVGIALSADETEIWWEPRCAGMIRTYLISGTALRAALPAGNSQTASPGTPPAPVCAIGLPPRLRDVVRALDSATAIERTASNGVLISGGGHSLLLFSQ